MPVASPGNGGAQGHPSSPFSATSQEDGGVGRNSWNWLRRGGVRQAIPRYRDVSHGIAKADVELAVDVHPDLAERLDVRADQG